MHFSFEVSGPGQQQPPQSKAEQAVPADQLELLKQLLEVQKQQLQLTKVLIAMNDGTHRWRTFLSRWDEQYPNMAGSCKEVLPQLERAYMDLIRDLTERLQDDGPDALDNEFAFNDFLDRYGMRLGQMGTILNLVTPLAEAYVPPQPATDESTTGES